MVNDHDQQEQPQSAAIPGGLCGMSMLCGEWIAPDETAPGYPGDAQPAAGAADEEGNEEGNEEEKKERD